MPDREKVIKGLLIERECVSRDCDRDCGKCDLVQDRDWLLSVYDDALALLKEDCHNCKLECLLQKYDELKEKYDKLLKEQEAVKPEVEVLNEIDRLYRCQRCHKHFFYEKQKYCDQCGQAVKWDG